MKNINKKTFSTLCAALVASVLIVAPPSYAADKTDNKKAVAEQAITQVNINKASFKDLMASKGIGEKKAMAIVKYRNSIGKFKNIEQLLEVKGIGEKFIEKNRNLISL